MSKHWYTVIYIRHPFDYVVSYTVALLSIIYDVIKYEVQTYTQRCDRRSLQEHRGLEVVNSIPESGDTRKGITIIFTILYVPLK